jgi:hypothetical protein
VFEIDDRDAECDFDPDTETKSDNDQPSTGSSEALMAHGLSRIEAVNRAGSNV